jgi:hypothetical protein
VLSWIFVTSSAISDGAASHPTRHPVIAYVFEQEFTVTTRSGRSASAAVPVTSRS